VSSPSAIKTWPPKVGDFVEEDVGKREPKKWEVRGVVDNRVVMRTWQTNRQRWHYAVEHVFWFHVRGWDVTEEDINLCYPEPDPEIWEVRDEDDE